MGCNKFSFAVGSQITQALPACASFLQEGSDKGGVQVFFSPLADTKGVELYPIFFSVQIYNSAVTGLMKTPAAN